MSKKKSILRGGVFAVIAVLLILPVMVIAGSLEPSAAPAPTMKTLDEIPPTWSQTLPAATRFVLVLGGAGVLDKETGLVWEQSPITLTGSWSEVPCYTKLVGNRRGWRLPTVEELASLVDAAQSNPSLPSGHPFSNVQSSVYWSSTTNAPNPSYAWGVSFSNGFLDVPDKASYHHVWCVRGGQGHDGW